MFGGILHRTVRQSPFFGVNSLLTLLKNRHRWASGWSWDRTRAALHALHVFLVLHDTTKD
jgi:hypothetical protein